MSAFDKVDSAKIPGLTKLAALCWVIVLSILWLINLSSVLAFFNVSYLRETLIIVFIMMSFWLYRQVNALVSYRHASIGAALGIDVSRVFLKKIKRIDGKINKLQERKVWLESYLSDEAKQTRLKEGKKDDKTNIGAKEGESQSENRTNESEI